MQRARTLLPAEDLELCLDFADTVDWRTSQNPKDMLEFYDDLVNWSQKKGVIDVNESKRLLTLARAEKMSANEALERAKLLREAIYRIFSSIAHGRKASPDDVKLLNDHLGRSMAKMEVHITDEGYELGWCTEYSPDRMLYPIAKSAAELLTSDHLSRVRECANEDEGCGSMFLDFSKSHSRRWCSMDSCGNKAKVRTYYARHARRPSNR
jgi:predicted RNA-binding Zn ribbon-like protein